MVKAANSQEIEPDSPLGLATTGGIVWKLLLWVGLLGAFFPVLSDLWSHFLSQPWSRVCVVFPGLIWLASQNAPGRIRPAAWGWALVAVGVLIELVATGGSVVRLGRLGLPIAALGLCVAGGWIPARVGPLFAFIVPFPAAMVNPLGLVVRDVFVELATMLIGGLGMSLELETARKMIIASAPNGRFIFTAVEGGVQTAVWCAGLGWFASIWRAGRNDPWSVRFGIQSAVRWAFAAFLVQFGLICVTVTGLASGVSADLIRSSLDFSYWFGVIAVGLAIALWSRGRITTGVVGPGGAIR